MESTVPHGKSTASKFSAEEKVDTTAACDIVYNTMKALKFHPLPNYDHPLVPDSDAYWDSLRDLDGATKAKFLKDAKGGVCMGEFLSPSIPRDNRLAVGIYSTYLLWLDDVAPTEDLKVFRKYCISDRSKLSTPLRHFADFLDTLTGYYGPHAGDSIWSATIQYVNSVVVEDIHGKGVVIPRSAVLFSDYQRLKSGVAEPYSWFGFCQADLPEEDWLTGELFILADLVDYINSANDLLSFYKEHVIGEEQFTYIWNYSSCHDIPLVDGLKITASRVLNAVERMRTTSAGQPKLLAKMEELVLGYMQWHWFYNGRYHLQEMYQLHIAPQIHDLNDTKTESGQIELDEWRTNERQLC